MLGVIFDCDGVLVDSEYFHYLSWNEALKKLGHSFTEQDYMPFVGQSAPLISERLFGQIQKGSPELLFNYKKEAFHQLQQQGIPPLTEAVLFVKRLGEIKKSKGFKMAVASAAPKKELLFNLKQLGVEAIFDEIVSGADDLKDYLDPEGTNKPKPYIYLQTAKLLGLPPTSCIAFEDSHSGVCAASSAGVITYAVPNFYTKGHDFSRAHYTINSFAEISEENLFSKI